MDEIVDNLPPVAVLGLGEAGAAIAADLLAAGTMVSGWDPVAEPRLDGLRRAAGPAAAVADAAVVLSVNRASAALALAAEVAPAMAAGAVFADLNTASPGLKAEVAKVVEAAGASFADVALLAPVPGRGLATPALASGSGAGALVAALAPLGASIEALGPRAGEAAECKLLRSVFVKGMAIAALEALEAARAAGCEDWLRGQLVTTLAGADEALLDRWLGGSRAHAPRRAEEMAAAGAMLVDLGTPAAITTAAGQWFELLAEEAAGAR